MLAYSSDECYPEVDFYLLDLVKLLFTPAIVYYWFFKQLTL